MKTLLGQIADLFRPSVVLMVDGGVCSQMNQYLMGAYLMQQGRRVEFELRFFHRDGRDADGVHVRNFDLLRLFPDLPFHEVSPLKWWVYKHLFPYYGFSEEDRAKRWWEVQAPRLVRGYFFLPKACYDLFAATFRPQPERVLDGPNLALYRSIAERDTVAVHVRRGDLAVARMGYGQPVGTDYYARAIAHFCDAHPHTHFYFFSDDPAYVREVLLPSLPHPVSHTIVENGDARGYMDLLLISRGLRIGYTASDEFGRLLATGLSFVKVVVYARDDENTDILQAVRGRLIAL